MVPIKAGASSPDFFVTIATIIPVLFLALVLEGGLWKWIREQVSDESDPSTGTRVFVSLLQFLAVFVLLAGALGEMTALYALWQEDYTGVLSDIAFWATALLVVLLTVELSLQVPGLLLLSFRSIDLRLLDGEELRWSGICARSTRIRVPYNTGKLFVTDKRLVWVTPKAAGLLGAPRVEIYSGELSEVIEGEEETPSRIRRWISDILSNILSPPPRHRLIVISSPHREYAFYPYEYAEALRSLRQLLPGEDDDGLGQPEPGDGTETELAT